MTPKIITAQCKLCDCWMSVVPMKGHKLPAQSMVNHLVDVHMPALFAFLVDGQPAIPEVNR
jgi:hypothetical protein